MNKIKPCKCPKCQEIFYMPSQGREIGGCGKTCPYCVHWIYGKHLTKAHKDAEEIPSSDKFASSLELAMEFGMAKNEANSFQNKIERICGNVLKFVKG